MISKKNKNMNYVVIFARTEGFLSKFYKESFLPAINNGNANILTIIILF